LKKGRSPKKIKTGKIKNREKPFIKKGKNL